MSDSWLSPKLLEKIANNVPFLQRALLALVKQDPSSIADVPNGGKRLVEISQGKWQLQQFNGTSWEPLGKLQMDVDTVDSFNATLTPQKNTIPVRDAKGNLPGNITGNASTADSAKTLSEVLEVEKGGTGASTPAQGRQNLGVPPTSHASSNQIYGLGSNLNYGHVRGDGVTTNVVAGEVVAKDIAIGGDSAKRASMFGQIGRNFSLPDDIDLDTVLTPGLYGVRGVTAKNTPTGSWGFLQVVNGYSKSDSAITQIWVSVSNINDLYIYIRSYVAPSWSPWRKTIMDKDFATKSSAGIVQPGDGLKAGNEGLVDVDDSVVRTSGNQSISGEKTFSYSLVSTANTLLRTQKYDISIADTSRPTQSNIMLSVVEDKDKKRFGGLEVSASLDGSRSMQFTMRNRTDTGWLVGVRFKELVDGTCFCETVPPPETSNENQIPTTAWVRRKIAESQDSTGTEISAASMVPDWGRRSNQALNTAYTAPENGYIYVKYNCSPGENYINLEYTPVGGSGLNYSIGRSYSSSSSNGATVIPVKKGDTYKIAASGGVQSTPVFIPAKK